jgi:hypothetical protein
MRFHVFERKVKGKPNMEPEKVPPFMFQQMPSHKYERTVTIKDKDGKDINKLKVIKLINNEGLRLGGSTWHCESCHQKIAYNNAGAHILPSKYEEAKN